MATLPTLRYPNKYDKNMPFITFVPCAYNASVPTNLFEPPAASRDYNVNVSRVALYMPGDVSENISAGWGLEEVYQGSGGASLLGMANANLKNAVSSKIDAKSVASTEAFAGATTLPIDILIFKAIDPMSISFNFTMIPYDKSEGDIILKICNNFKRNIMPKVPLNSGSTIMKFPVIWDLQYTGIKGLGINGSNSHQMMALTNCNVTYSSGGIGASVYHDGNPVQINLSLSFQHIKKHVIGENE